MTSLSYEEYTRVESNRRADEVKRRKDFARTLVENGIVGSYVFDEFMAIMWHVREEIIRKKGGDYPHIVDKLPEINLKD